MKKRNLVKTMVIVGLVIVMLLQLVSCNNKKGAEKTVLDHVFRRTEITLPDNIQSVNNILNVGDRINIIGSGYDQETYENYYVFYSINQDGTDPQEHMLNLNLSKMEGYEGSYMSNIIMLPNEKFLVSIEAWGSDKISGNYKSDNFLVMMDLEGNIDKKVNVRELLEDHLDQDYFYINNIVVDSQSNIYINSDRTVFVLDENFNFSFKVELNENSWLNRLFVYSDGKIAAAINSEGSEGYETKLKILDPVEKKFTDEIEINDHLMNNIYSLFTGKDGNIYYSTQSGIYGYDSNTNESNEILNWINSDIENPNVGMISAISEKKFVCVGYEYDTTTWMSSYYLMMLDYIPPEEVTPKYIITLATAYSSYEIRSAVIKFNRKSQEYRIQIKDYMDQEDFTDYTEVMDKINNDIIAGNMPDILLVNSEMPFDSYVSKGLFYDLYKLIDKDESFNKDDYFQNVLDALSVNGKLYSISPTFNINTVAIKSKFVEPGATGWTMGELQALLAKLPDETVTFLGENREGVMRIAMNLTLSQFIDKDTARTSFDSQDFIDILKFVKTFDEKSFWENIDYENLPPDFWDKYNKSHEEDRAILYNMSLNSFYNYIDAKYYNFKDDITLIGFPNSQRKGSTISVYERITISSKSKLVDGAWEFVKYFLSDEYQDNISYEWPIKISSFDKMGERAIKGEDDGGIIRPLMESAGDSYDIMPYPIEQPKVSEEDVAYIKSFIQSIDTLQTYEAGVMEIINEETKMYFAGNKTAEETAKIIQSRVQIYVSESR